MIKLLFMDIDGTLTDGKIYIGREGEVMKGFDVKDGYAIHTILRQNGIEPVIITGRESEIVRRRAQELNVRLLYQNVSDKSKKIQEQLQECDNVNGYDEVAYIGDDLNDLPAMLMIKEKGGVVGCPNDAVKDVKEISHYICKNKGGNGAVREYIEWLIDRG